MDLNYDKVAGEVLSLKQSGDKSFWVNLARKYGKTPDALRSWFERERRKRLAMETLLDSEDENKNDFDDSNFYGEPEEESVQEEIKYKGSISSKNKDGQKFFTSERLVRMHEEDLKNDCFVLKAHGFDPEQWILLSATNNYWQTPREKDKGAATLYQSKITAKPISKNKDITFADIEEFFENFDGRNIFPIKNNSTVMTSSSSDGDTLIVNLADLHFGNEESNYRTSSKVLNILSSIKDKALNKKIKKIIVSILGDTIHVDTEGGTTTSGTQVGERGTIYYHWEEALISLLNFISELSNIAEVECISVSGNHDRVNGYTLSKALEYAMLKSNQNVSFDVSFSHRKYKMIGNSLFGFTHGDMPSKNQGQILQSEQREKFGISKYAYLLMGHVHHLTMKDEGNVITMSLPSVTPVDYWHEQNGYVGAWRGSVCHLVSDDKGIVETWYISV